MAEENDYEVKAVEKKAKDIEDIIDKEALREDSRPLQEKGPQTPRSPQAPTRKGFKIPQIPADKIFRTMTNKEMMMQTLHDETMEPHVHLTILLLIVFVLAIIIALLGI